MIFSATCWHGWDQAPATDGDDEDEAPPSWNTPLPHLQYCISIFGRDAEGRSVCVTAEFHPFFYVQLPARWLPSDTATYLKELGRLHPARHRCGVVPAKDFHGFTNGRGRNFLRLAFHSHKYCRWAQKAVKKNPADPLHPTIYQGNVEPRLQLLHERDLKPAGWIEVDRSTPASRYDRLSTCELEVHCSWTALKPASDPPKEPPPLVVVRPVLAEK